MTHDSTSDVTRAGRVTRRYVTRKVVPVSGPGGGGRGKSRFLNHVTYTWRGRVAACVTEVAWRGFVCPPNVVISTI